LHRHLFRFEKMANELEVPLSDFQTIFERLYKERAMSAKPS
jgi:hypothetical protein